jgi:hypothetical protein
MKKLVGLVSSLVLLSLACSKNDNKDDNNNPGTVDCNSINAQFAANVAPLIATNCAKAGCHATGSINGPGALTTYAQISGNKAAIRAAVSDGRMPKDATLSATQKATIICWIDAGAADN